MLLIPTKYVEFTNEVHISLTKKNLSILLVSEKSRYKKGRKGGLEKPVGVVFY